MTVSKNPPLTEDQIRQSAEAEATHAAAQASRNSQLDYLIAEQRQQQAAAALETIFGSEEDRFKAAASKIEDSAHRAMGGSESDAATRRACVAYAGLARVHGPRVGCAAASQETAWLGHS